jgi:hypothetical protein
VPGVPSNDVWYRAAGEFYVTDSAMATQGIPDNRVPPC